MSAADHRAIDPGYVHRCFLLWKHGKTPLREFVEPTLATATVSLGALLSKFVLVTLVLVLSLVASLAMAQQSGEGEGSVANNDSHARAVRRVAGQALQQLLVIDVRRPDEVTAIGGLPVYLSVQLSDLDKYTAWIPKDRKIVTISNHAGRAGRAVICSRPRASMSRPHWRTEL